MDQVAHPAPTPRTLRLRAIGEDASQSVADRNVSAASWLIRDGMDRERMLDMDRRLQPIRHMSFVALALALMLNGPWLGWWTIIPLAVAGVMFRSADSFAERVARPEYALLAAWVGSEVMIAASVVVTGGPKSPIVMWFAVPIVTLSARFSTRGVAVGVAAAVVVMLAATLGVNADAVINDPPLLSMPIAMIIAVAILSTALMHSDLKHRSEAVVDQLTGLLNRNALAARTAELEQQSEHTGQPIGLILGDLDHFKQVNDSHGHAIGDAVLRDVTYLLRKQLRAFDIAYRIGGEEFLMLLPGADLRQTAAMAERLREAVAADPVAGDLHMTMSFGVTASAPYARFDFDTVCAEADTALYDAKRSGRNRVCGGRSDDGNSWETASPMSVIHNVASSRGTAPILD